MNNSRIKAYTSRPNEKISSILKDTCNLDVLDANYIYSSEKMDYYSILKNKNRLPRRKGVVIRIMIAIARCRAALVKKRQWTPCELFCGDILFPYCTQNQYSAVQPVAEQLDAIKGVSIPTSVLSPTTFSSRFVSLFFIVPALMHRSKANEYQKRMMTCFFDEYLFCYGHYLNTRFFLRHHRPKAVLVANDHSADTRVIALAARDGGVPTIYMQHASVSAKFPPLIYDYAFLDGQDALNKYLNKERTKTKIFLSGIPKLDSLMKDQEKRTSVGSIGVAINLLDDLAKVTQITKKLRLQFSAQKIVLRPHPALGEEIEELRHYCVKEGVIFSDSANETVGDFMSQIDILISGESNIHLEATLMNIVSIYYAFGETCRDHYGFLKEKLVLECQNFEQLVSSIKDVTKNYPEVRQKAKLYCATIDTSYHGRSAALVAESISAIFDREQEIGGPWCESSRGEEIYELAAVSAD